MKYLILTLFAIMCFGTCKAQEWYEEGSLHKSTIREWHRATPSNRLATAADWVAVIYKKELSKSNSWESDLYYYSRRLVRCINVSTRGLYSIYNNDTVSIAAACDTLQ